MTHNQKFITSTALAEREKREVMERLFHGEVGNLFDPLQEGNCHWGGIFPRLRNQILSRKTIPQERMITVFHNLVNIGADRVANFVMDSKINRVWEEGDVDRIRKFDAFWQEQRMDRKVFNTLHRSIAMGYEGMRAVKHMGKVRFVPFRYDEYYEDFMGNSFIWRPFTSERGKRYVHLISIYEGENGLYNAKHSLHEMDSGEINMLGKIIPLSRAGGIAPEFKPLGELPDGFEWKDVPFKPLFLIQNTNIAQDGMGESLFANALHSIEQLALMDTSISIEISAHYSSKLTAPQSLFAPDPNGKQRTDLLAQDILFLPDSPNAQKPEYIEKNLSEANEVIQQQRRNAFSMFSLATGIPFDFLFHDKDNNSVRVEAIRSKRLQFERKVKSLQSELEIADKNMADFWFWVTYGEKAPEYDIQFRDVSSLDDSVQVKQMYIQLKNDGNITQRTLLQNMFREWSEAKIDTEIAKTSGNQEQIITQEENGSETLPVSD